MRLTRLDAGIFLVSFSVLEHVVDRRRYLQAARANLAPGGRAYLNYDSGHFTVDADPAERAKAVLSPSIETSPCFNACGGVSSPWASRKNVCMSVSTTTAASSTAPVEACIRLPASA